jgi:hypothetical protein
MVLACPKTMSINHRGRFYPEQHKLQQNHCVDTDLDSVVTSTPLCSQLNSSRSNWGMFPASHHPVLSGGDKLDGTDFGQLISLFVLLSHASGDFLLQYCGALGFEQQSLKHQQIISP